MSSSITHLNTKSRTFSTSTTSSTSTPASPTTTTSSSSSNDSHTQKFLDKVKSFVPQHHHHHQSKKSYPQPPTYVPQQPPQHRTSTDSMHGVERRPTVTMYGRHSNEWLFGGVSVRKVVGGLFQHED